MCDTLPRILSMVFAPSQRRKKGKEGKKWRGVIERIGRERERRKEKGDEGRKKGRNERKGAGKYLTVVPTHTEREESILIKNYHDIRHHSGIASD